MTTYSVEVIYPQTHAGVSLVTSAESRAAAVAELTDILRTEEGLPERVAPRFVVHVLNEPQGDPYDYHP